MLVLSRKAGERLEFILPDGRQAAVVVVRIDQGKHVKLGCEFPRDIQIWREELHRTPSSTTITGKVAEIQEAMQTLLLLIKSLDVEVTNPAAMRIVSEARALIGTLEGNKTKTEDALDLEENTRRDSHRWSDHT